MACRQSDIKKSDKSKGRDIDDSQMLKILTNEQRSKEKVKKRELSRHNKHLNIQPVKSQREKHILCKSTRCWVLYSIKCFVL